MKSAPERGTSRLHTRREVTPLDDILLVAGAWCLLALLIFIAARPALRANRREEVELGAAELEPAVSVPRHADVPSPAGAQERAAHLLDTGYLGLVHDRL